jgi:hypothetical protein
MVLALRRKGALYHVSITRRHLQYLEQDIHIVPRLQVLFMKHAILFETIYVFDP